MFNKLIKFFCFGLMFFSVFGFGQIMSSSIDKTRLGVGEVGVYKIQISDLDGKDVVIAPKGQLLPFHFEVLNDSIAKQKDLYQRIVKFQIFEEGEFTIPEIEVKVAEKELKTIPYKVDVFINSRADEQLNDIMKNKEVALSFSDYWELYKFYVLGFLLVVGIIILIFGFFKYVRKAKSEPVENTNQTLRELDKLKKKNYIKNQNYRDFYIELVDITRAFIVKQYQIPADVLLTDDLIDYMKESNAVSQENEKIVAQVFLTADLVKFAKTIPTQETMTDDFKSIRDFVKRSTDDVEAEKLRTLS